MKTRLVQVGNSRGVRIPKRLAERCALGETGDLRVENRCLVISAACPPRQNWTEVFRKAGTAAQDELIMGPAARDDFGNMEWKW